MFLRKKALAVISMTILVAFCASGVASAASSASRGGPYDTSSYTVAQGHSTATSSWTLTAPNIIQVRSDATQVDFILIESNNSGADAQCDVHFLERDHITPLVTIANGSSVQTGIATYLPSERVSTFTFIMRCDNTVVAIATSKVILTGPLAPADL